MGIGIVTEYPVVWLEVCPFGIHINSNHILYATFYSHVVNLPRGNLVIGVDAISDHEVTERVQWIVGTGVHIVHPHESQHP